ncbi:MAG: phospho-sugar mutase [Bifidobacteriaceae bacterium]|jgi:phosphomannomutase|nr:phospho-sugar mutase [Bifidobacteriaceae bacterium]
MPSLSNALKSKVEAWIAADPDAASRDELTGLLQAAESGDESAAADLADAFKAPLAFGTAGLRGRLGPGPGRMNRAVVIRAAAGLMAYLHGVIGQQGQPPQPGQPAQPEQSKQPKQPEQPPAKPTGAEILANLTDTAINRFAVLRRAKIKAANPPKVVIGYDARRGSAEFALDTAAVVVAAGGRALLWQQTCPTPLLAYAVRHLSADAGVMVTASHNPAQDNGYKVYLGGRAAAGPAQGVQIVPPADSQIAARIAEAPPANQIKRAARGWETIGADQEREYSRQAVAGATPAPGAADLRIVHTAMHGVGARIALPAFEQAGFTDVHQVPEQARPDPDFPTVAFPNPEEPGAIDLAKALAERIAADLVIAQDPDADRCAAAVFDPHGPRGGHWRMLTGDEVGALLGEEVAKAWRDSPELPDAARPTLASSVVSSRLMSRIARDHLLAYQRTLTGFKWIARVPGLVFGYEEAIGYCVRPDMVRDKDGITAGLAIARLAARAKLGRKTLIDLLDDLARRHGLHATGQVALRFEDASRLGEVMRGLRRAAPSAIGEVPVARTVDLASGWEGLPGTDALIFSLADGSRVVVRPSGTEPKIKCYLEVVAPVPPTAEFAAVTAIRRQAADHLAALSQATRALLQPPR